jgi:hypothetical protein
MIQVTLVILCGGSGTRLWLLLRTGFFLNNSFTRQVTPAK